MDFVIKIKNTALFSTNLNESYFIIESNFDYSFFKICFCKSVAVKK